MVYLSPVKADGKSRFIPSDGSYVPTSANNK